MGRQPRRDGDGGPLALSVTEWVLLGLLREDSSHGFALAKQLRRDTDLGRILTVRRPLVYRALDRLVGLGLVEPESTEPGDSGPTRTVHRITASGLEAIDRWLEEPVDHVRDLRVEFLVKLRLLERSDRAPDRLIAAQRSALGRTLERLTDRPGGDVVDLWRAESAMAAKRFLDELGGGR